MKFKVICINDNINSQLKVNQYYIANGYSHLTYGNRDVLYCIFNLEGGYIGYFNKNMFKTMKQIREEKIQELI